MLSQSFLLFLKFPNVINQTLYLLLEILIESDLLLIRFHPDNAINLCHYLIPFIHDRIRPISQSYILFIYLMDFSLQLLTLQIPLLDQALQQIDLIPQLSQVGLITEYLLPSRRFLLVVQFQLSKLGLLQSHLISGLLYYYQYVFVLLFQLSVGPHECIDVVL